MNDSHQLVDDWLREGRSLPRPTPVTRHLAVCDDCRDTMADFDATQALFAVSPPPLSEDVVGAIRFRLESAAREGQGRPRTVARARLRFALAAAALVLLAAGAGLWWQERPAAGVVSARVVSWSAGASYQLDAEERQLTLRGGLLGIAVEGRPLVVVVGDQRVELADARVVIGAASDVLQSVLVEEGRVVVLSGGGGRTELTGGSAWRRPAPPAPERVSSPAPQPAPSAPAQRANVAGPRRALPAAPLPVQAPHTAAPSSQPSVDLDAAFAAAWQLKRAGRADAAAHAFDVLLERGDLGARRPDVLFWSATQHERAGRLMVAHERLRTLVADHPDAWHAIEARRRLGQDPVAPGKQTP